jgi:hypothetical protein
MDTGAIDAFWIGSVFGHAWDVFVRSNGEWHQLAQVESLEGVATHLLRAIARDQNSEYIASILVRHRLELRAAESPNGVFAVLASDVRGWIRDACSWYHWIRFRPQFEQQIAKQQLLNERYARRFRTIAILQGGRADGNSGGRR